LVKIKQKGLRQELGASSVEFALVLPALVLILFSILEYGWYMTQQITLANAVAAGARAGVKAREWDEDNPQDPAQTARLTVQESFWLSDIPEGSIAVDSEYRLTVGGPRMIEVKVLNLPYVPLTGYLPDSLLPSGLSAKAVMAFP
jgi:hypothetical protein